MHSHKIRQQSIIWFIIFASLVVIVSSARGANVPPPLAPPPAVDSGSTPPAHVPARSYPNLRAGMGLKVLNGNTMRVRIVVKNRGGGNAWGVNVTTRVGSKFRYWRAPKHARLVRGGMATMRYTIGAGERQVIGLRIRRVSRVVRCVTVTGAVELGETKNLSKRACWKNR